MINVKKLIKNILKHNETLRILARRINAANKQRRYRKIATGVELDDKLVLFETFMGRQYGCNPKWIYEYMVSRPELEDYRFVWVDRDKEKKEEMQCLSRTEVVIHQSVEYYKACAKAKYIITNSILDNGILKKEGQVFIQTWHGTPLKKLRCDKMM